jgi:signal transduction histidine kinase
LRDLLDLTQPRVHNIRRCSLAKLIKRVVLLASHYATSLPNRDVDVEFIEATPAESIEMQVDPAQLEDTVLNLVVNAIESIEKSGRVTVQLSRRGKDIGEDEAVITVSDTGCGIAHADRPRTGIGLSAVIRTVEAFNGDINVDTGGERGSTFEISLPLTPIHPDSHEL